MYKIMSMLSIISLSLIHSDREALFLDLWQMKMRLRIHLFKGISLNRERQDLNLLTLSSLVLIFSETVEKDDFESRVSSS